MAHLLYLSHEWDFETYGASEISWTDDDGPHTVTFSSGIYRHPGATADSLTHPSGGLAISNTAHAHFAAALQAAMNVASPTLLVEVTWKESTNRYTIDSLSGGHSIFSVTWSSDAQLRMQALLGFAANIAAPASSVGTLVPMFSIEPTKQALTGWTDGRAKAQTTQVRYTASGDLSTIGPARKPWVGRFELQSETDAHTMSEFAGTGYCWQQFWNDAGTNGRLCYLVDSDPPVGDDMRWAFKLNNPDFDESTHRREVASLRDRWHLMFDVLLRGRW